MTNRPSISVIIPSYNGAHKIGTLLNAIIKQTVLPDQTIVVLDGSMDSTVTIAKTFEKLLVNLRVIETPNRGRSFARNIGVKESKSDLLIFFDDDMEPQQDSIERHLKFHETQEGLLTGNQIDIYTPVKSDIQNYKAFLSEKWTEKYTDGLSRLEASNLFFTAAVCSIKKADFELLQGFNEKLTDAEDYELALRAMKLGLPIYFDKSLVAVHHDMITCASYIKRQIQYDNAHKRLRQQGIHSNYDVWNETLLKKVFYWFFSFGWWQTLIDRSRVLLILPRSIRYKIYDWIIFSQSRVYPKGLN